MYPLKFHSIDKAKVWGHELWTLSGYGADMSLVANGPLAGQSLHQLMHEYGSELVGQHVYARFGNLFPLLFKVIDARDDLSIQVHPNDEQAVALSAGSADVPAMGKTEMWFVLDTDDGASIINGFAKDTSREEVLAKTESLQLPSILQTVNVNYGDVAYIPAGQIHALRRGTVVAEIQETSDITYRVYDYHRPDKDGNYRELHVDKAVSVLNYERTTPPLVPYRLPAVNTVCNLVTDPHFTTNYIRLTQTVRRDYSALDSFVVYMCVWGQMEVRVADADNGLETLTLKKGETALLPASLVDVSLRPLTTQSRVLEVYIA